MQNSTETIDWVGVAFIALPIAFAIPYLLILKIIVSTEELWDKSGYKLIFHLGMCDLMQLTSHICTGLVSVTRCTCSIIRQQKWIGLCYTFGAVLVLGSQTVFNFVFDQSLHTFIYQPQWVEVVDLLYCIFNMIATAVVYMSAWYCLHKTASGTANPSSEMRAETRLAAQGLSVWLAMLLFMTVWFLQVFGPTAWIYLILSMFVNGTNPVIYIVFNKTIKTKFFQSFGWNPNRVQSVSASRRA